MPAVSLEQPNMQAFSRAFAGKIRELSVSQETSEKREITPRDVYQPARPKNRAVFQEICKTLMLQDSRITGVENLAELARRAEQGEPGIVLSWHSSNLDVPNLQALLDKADQPELFEKLVFVAGRKLNEESPLCKAFCETFTRLIVSPPSYFKKHEGEPLKIAQARAVNMAALRMARRILKQGSLLFLFPTGTRYRSHKPESARALPQVDGYLRMCKNFVVMNIHGNTLPPLNRQSMIDDAVRCDTIRMSIGPVTSVEEFRKDVVQQARLNNENPRQAVADSIMDLIHCL
jgi:1-acyl-sn-glycerol-3-phosphate acyltransferase